MTVINVGPTRAYTTINNAYKSASSGDVLLIDEGTYNEHLKLDSKWVHLIGNTRNPGAGKVIIQRIDAEDEVLYFYRISGNPTIYIEGIKLNWVPYTNTSTSNDQPITFYECWSIHVVFNRCIIDASNDWYYIFDSNNSALESMKLYNCRFNYKIDSDWDSNGNYDQFDRNNGRVRIDMRKCILPYMIEQASANTPVFPNGQQYNLANNSNTTSDFSSQWKLFSASYYEYAELNSPVSGQTYYINSDLGSSKIVTKFGFCVYSNESYIGDVWLEASNDQLSWVTLRTWPDGYRTSEVYLDILNNNIAFQYYRFAIESTSTNNIWLSAFILLEKGNDDPFFDYVQPPGKYGYGPVFGEFIYNTPNQYYFSGNVNDVILDNTLIDTVTFNSSDKASQVSLSNDDHRASVSTSYKYSDYGVRATTSRNTGKWYWEYYIVSSTYGENRLGVSLSASSLYEPLGTDSFGWGYEERTGYIYNNSVVMASGPVLEVGDVLGIAYDAYNGKIWFSVNGVWILDGDPENGLNPTIEIQADLFPTVTLNSSSSSASTVDFITAVSSLNYDIPTGFIFYGTSVIWRIKAINADTNAFVSHTYSDPRDGSYELFTTYSGEQFLICEDAAEPPNYNDLLLGRMTPEVW